MYTNNSSDQKKSLRAELSTYLKLRKRKLELQTLEKGSQLLGNFILVLTGLIFGSFALLCLSFALAIYLGQVLGGAVYGFLIIAGLYILLIALLFIFRVRLLINPMVRLLNHSLFTPKKPTDSTHLTPQQDGSQTRY